MIVDGTRGGLERVRLDWPEDTGNQFAVDMDQWTETVDLVGIRGGDAIPLDDQTLREQAFE
jgi:hypothetical protein